MRLGPRALGCATASLASIRVRRGAAFVADAGVAMPGSSIDGEVGLSITFYIDNELALSCEQAASERCSRVL